MNAKYRQYGLLVNIFVVVSVLLASKYIFTQLSHIENRKFPI